MFDRYNIDILKVHEGQGVFKAKPPTMEEFLTPKYLGEDTNSKVFSYWKPILIDYWDNNITETFPGHFEMELPSETIGKGLSTASALSVMYQVYVLGLMNKPSKFFSLCPGVSFSILNLVKRHSDTAIQDALRVLISRSPAFINRHDKEKYPLLYPFVEWDETSLGVFKFSFLSKESLLFRQATTLNSVLGSHLIGAIVSHEIQHEEKAQIVRDISSRIFSRFTNSWFTRLITHKTNEKFVVSASQLK